MTEHEPDCKLYFALTKCDLLEQLPGIGTDASHLEPSPQESGTHSSHCSAATLLLLDSDKRKALLGCSSCFDCLTCDADQSNLAATPDSGKDSFSSEEGIAICQQEVSDEDISAYAKLHQAQVFSTSAKTGIGVRRMFSSIAQDLAAGTMQESHVQHTHRHAARPVTPTFMSSRPGTNPSSPLENSHNSTYSRTRKKYCQNCCF